MFLAALDQSLLMFPLVLGIYLSYCILKTTDLTVDGSFVLGAAAYARGLHAGFGHLLSILLALVAGGAAGVGVSMIQKYARLPGLTSSILMLFMLYSINFEVMGKPNLSLLSFDVLEGVDPSSHTLIKMAIGLGLALIITAVLVVLLRSRYGILLRAYGHTPQVMARYRKSPHFYRTLGLMLSNGLAALCGVLTAQFSGYADINMGFGMALTGIGAVVIGGHLFQRFTQARGFAPSIDIAACFVGVYLYFLLVHFLLRCHVNPIHLKLFVGILLICSLRTAHFKKGASS